MTRVSTELFDVVSFPSCGATYVLPEIAETLFQPFHHWQEIVVEHEVVARGIEHALCGFEKGEECESVSELRRVCKQMGLMSGISTSTRRSDNDQRRISLSGITHLLLEQVLACTT
jgi:hypothetical protein